MKKVLIVATVDLHIKTFHIPYLKLLHDNSYEVHIATNGNEKFPYCDKKHQICIERNPFKFKNIKAIYQLKKIIENERFDIIHCHTPMGAVVTRLAAKHARKKYGTRVIYTAHGFHFYKGAPLINWIIYYPIEKWLSKYTDTLVTINKEDFDLANNRFKKRCNDIEYVQGVGIDVYKYKNQLSDKEKTEFKKTLYLNENDYVITCIARLDKNKNQGFLINTMSQLVKKNEKIHLLLVGQDELNGQYQRIVNKLNLINNIHFLGRREDISNILAITDIVVSSSLREGLPVNVIEAFAAGKPVVALNCRGMEDLIENEINGYIVDNKADISAFIEKIFTILNLTESQKNVIFLKNISKANHYDIQFILNEFSKIYF